MGNSINLKSRKSRFSGLAACRGSALKSSPFMA